MNLGLLARALAVGSLLAAAVVPAAEAAAPAGATQSQTSGATGVLERGSTLPAPRSLTATLHDASVGLSWTRVDGATRYGVVVWPVGVQGPQRTRWVKGGKHYKSIAVSSLPTNGNGGFRMQVFAYADSYGKSAYTHIRIARFKKKVIRRRHYEQDDETTLKAATRVAKNCARDGLSVAVGTVVVGAPFVAFSVPIPGIGEVTTAGLAAVAGVAGGGATVACFAGNVLGGS